MPLVTSTAGSYRPIKLSHQKRESKKLSSETQLSKLTHEAKSSTPSYLDLLDSQIGPKPDQLYASVSASTDDDEEDATALTSTSQFIVGSRKSCLAVTQTKQVVALLQQVLPTATFPLNLISTTGDKIQSVSLSKIGEKALFTKELEYALMDSAVDLVVHSLKDLPTVLPDGMAISAILKREDPRDVSIMSSKYSCCTLATLPEGSVVGTSSVRRIAQLKRAYPHLVFQDIRGNLNTRFAKLNAEDSIYSAIILAAAGVHRLGFTHTIGEYIDSDVMLYAVGQGALAIETRSNDYRVESLLKHVVDTRTMLTCTAERALMRCLEGGCSVPIGVNCTWANSDQQGAGDQIIGSHQTDVSAMQFMRLVGMVSSVDGKDYLKCSHVGFVVPKEIVPVIDQFELLDNAQIELLVSNAEKVGCDLAKQMIALGADHILADIPRH
ncbi:hypothetical protein BB561_005133 [Smittium simulii]|uniref:hydroxymethylbilane synthase n=1 Tax=Smittium simulii TaxID=133385 RepID=A0A2T9YC57_9FUNG|nr:hypothetical protein BB561_005133 [Smittium simulii]